MKDVSEYVKAGDDELEELRFPALDAAAVLAQGWMVWGKECRRLGNEKRKHSNENGADAVSSQPAKAKRQKGGPE